MIGHDDPKLARIIGALRVTRDVDAGAYLEVRLFGHRPEVRLIRGKPRATGAVLDPYVAVQTGPAAFPVGTGSPARLRRLARLLEEYADGLDALLNPPPQPDGEQLDLLANLTQEPNPCPATRPMRTASPL